MIKIYLASINHSHVSFKDIPHTNNEDPFKKTKLGPRHFYFFRTSGYHKLTKEFEHVFFIIKN